MIHKLLGSKSQHSAQWEAAFEKRVSIKILSKYKLKFLILKLSDIFGEPCFGKHGPGLE